MPALRLQFRRRRCRSQGDELASSSPSSAAGRTRARRCAPGSARPLPVVGAWVAGQPRGRGAAAAATWVVAHLEQPDPIAFAVGTATGELRRLRVHPLPQRARAGAARDGLRRGLHRRLARCRSSPRATRGSWRRVHDHAGPLAIAFVAVATLFSLCTQAYALGHGRLERSPTRSGMLAGSAAHRAAAARAAGAVALFLPLAAWLSPAAAGLGRAARRDVRDHGDRGTRLVAAAAVEVWVTPHVLYFLK